MEFNRSTIEDAENQLAAKIRSLNLFAELVPSDFSVRVTLLNQKGRKKHRDASIASWSPDSDAVEITFERRAHEQPYSIHPEGPSSENTESVAKSDTMAKLIRALDRVEHRPGYQFVALKWFRDFVLAAEDVSSDTLVEAIECRIVITGKVPNPKDSRFPVTSVRLNRSVPQVHQVLEEFRRHARAGFSPLPSSRIRGELLSATVLRERR